jgi:DNA primase
VKSAKPILDYVIERLLRDCEDNNELKARRIERLAYLMAEIESPVKKSLYVKRIAELTGCSEDSIYQSVKSSRKSHHASEGVDSDGYPLVEREIVRILLEHEQLIPLARQERIQTKFGDERLRSICEEIIEYYFSKGSIDVTDLIDRIQDTKTKDFVARVCVQPQRYPRDVAEKSLKQMFMKIPLNRKKAQMERIPREMLDRNKWDEQIELLRQQSKMSKDYYIIKDKFAEV